MSRILNPANNQWYDELKAVSYYGETEFERWIHQHAKSLFPHHYTIPFKREVASKRTAEIKKPDFALFTHDFSAWVVVEVELERHELDHVLSQTRVFVAGEYNLPAITQYVRDQFWKYHQKHVTLGKLKNLFVAGPPSVLVIVDEHIEDLKTELEKLGVNFCILEIYKNATSQHLYRILGKYPAVEIDTAHCRPDKSIPNLIEVIGDFTFEQIGRAESVHIFYNEYLTRWTLLRDRKRQYLRFMGKTNPLSPNDMYSLSRDKSNKYYFKRS